MGKMYKCGYCGEALDWESGDGNGNEPWVCEECGKVFCTDCFIKEHGVKEYYKMMQMLDENDLILCPDCYKNKISK